MADNFADQPGLAHRNAPATSHRAAKSVTGGSGTKRRRVFELIAKSLAKGKTADELAVDTGWAGNAVCPRVDELMKSGLVVYDEGRERPTRTGKGAHPLVLTEDGVDEALELEIIYHG